MALTVWSGASALDDSSTICLHVTGLDRTSKNRKTGPMLQTWIMCKAEHPVLAHAQGLDAAVCGDCPRRNGSCYVNLGQAPGAIYRNATQWTGNLTTLCTGRMVRLGAYGDPAAIPFEVWDLLLHEAAGWTGYTHQWRSCDQRLKRYCMASVDSLAERDEAHDLGWRTFRVGESDEQPVGRETLCPASEAAGNKLKCIECLHCSGLSGNRFGDVFIPVHGTASVLRAQQYIQRPGGIAGLAAGSGHKALSGPGGVYSAELRVRASSAATIQGGGPRGAQDQKAA